MSIKSGQDQRKKTVIYCNQKSCKFKLISYIFGCLNNDELGYIRCFLWTNHSNLREATNWSRYETLDEGMVVQVRHTWAQIERAIAIQMSLNLLRAFPIASLHRVVELCNKYPYIKEAGKRHFFIFKPAVSGTYQLLSSHMPEKLESKREALLSAVRLG